MMWYFGQCQVDSLRWVTRKVLLSCVYSADCLTLRHWRSKWVERLTNVSRLWRLNRMCRLLARWTKDASWKTGERLVLVLVDPTVRLHCVGRGSEGRSDWHAFFGRCCTYWHLCCGRSDVEDAVRQAEASMLREQLAAIQLL